jgi:hypothetical protein
LNTNPLSMCVALLCGVRYLYMGLHQNKDSVSPWDNEIK